MFPQGVSTAFFENLLPESDVRSILAFNNRFNKKDTFSFLEHFGQDCAGVLSIIPEDQSLDTTPWCYADITTDLINEHYGHRNIIEYCKRLFQVNHNHDPRGILDINASKYLVR
jgi:hypothetical protein